MTSHDAGTKGWTWMATKPLEQLIHELSPQLKAEVLDFVEFLLSKQPAQTPRRLRQDWARRLSSSKMTAVDLQHQASIWRSE